MAYKVLITPRSFGKHDPAVFDTLRASGLELLLNPTGTILSKEQMIENIPDCDGLIVGVDPVDADVIAAAGRLKAIAKYGVGLDNIDLDAAKARRIAVSKTVNANADAVADYALALMLALCRNLIPIDRKCRTGNWEKVTALDLSHKTLGVLGFGAIGKRVAQRAKGFSMRVLAYDVFWDDAYAKAHDIQKASPEQIYRESDFISLHLPLLPETQNFIGREQLDRMKPTAILINTARGGLINEQALLDALKNGRIYGAGIDAFLREPPDNPEWFSLPNVVIGSHCAASTEGAISAMSRMAAANLIHDLGLQI